MRLDIKKIGLDIKKDRIRYKKKIRLDKQRLAKIQKNKIR